MSPDCVKVSFHYGDEDFRKLMDRLILNRINGSVYTDMYRELENEEANKATRGKKV